MKTPDGFWHETAARYARLPIANQAAYEKKLQVTRQYLRPAMEVLEFGCGTGSTAIAHAPYVAHLRAIDISANMLEIARGKAAAAGVVNVTFEQAAIETLDVAPASFDAVLGLSILHLLEDRTAAVLKVHRLLKPGGVFVSSTLCLGDWTPLIKFIVPIGRWLGKIPMVKVFTARELTQCLAGAGFSIEHEWRHIQ